MEAEATKHLPNESGGILIGQFSEDGVLVTVAGDAGPRALHAAGEFRRDGEHAQRLRDDIVRRTGGAVDYIGEWHSHPCDADASGKDRRSMHEISTDAEFAISDPVLIVLRYDRVQRWTAASHQVVDGRLAALRIEVAERSAVAQRTS